jgi:hypothetical protein
MLPGAILVLLAFEEQDFHFRRNCRPIRNASCGPFLLFLLRLPRSG